MGLHWAPIQALIDSYQHPTGLTRRIGIKVWIAYHNR